VASLAFATQFKVLRNGGKGPFAAAYATNRHSKDDQSREIQGLKAETRGAKVRQTAKAAIEIHANLQLVMNPGKMLYGKVRGKPSAQSGCQLNLKYLFSAGEHFADILAQEMRVSPSKTDESHKAQARQAARRRMALQPETQSAIPDS
jgi:hypothetical protein